MAKAKEPRRVALEDAVEGVHYTQVADCETGEQWLEEIAEPDPDQLATEETAAPKSALEAALEALPPDEPVTPAKLLDLLRAEQ